MAHGFSSQRLLNPIYTIVLDSILAEHVARAGQRTSSEPHTPELSREVRNLHAEDGELGVLVVVCPDVRYHARPPVLALAGRPVGPSLVHRGDRRLSFSLLRCGHYSTAPACYKGRQLLRIADALG